MQIEAQTAVAAVTEPRYIGVFRQGKGGGGPSARLGKLQGASKRQESPEIVQMSFKSDIAGEMTGLRH